MGNANTGFVIIGIYLCEIFIKRRVCFFFAERCYFCRGGMASGLRGGLLEASNLRGEHDLQRD